MNSQAFVFFGRSGCGKGTQAKLLVDLLKSKKREVVYIETGNLLREFIKTEGYSSKLTSDVLKEGGLMPVFMPIWLWTQALVNSFSGKEDLLFDGVCRRREEAVVLDSAFDFYQIKKRNVILINVSKEWSYDRMIERKRGDDTIEQIKNRLDWYEKEVMPSFDYFREKNGYNFIEVNGEQTIEEVYKDIIKALAFE